MGLKYRSFSLKTLICLVGLGGMIGQLLLLREFYIVGGGNELVFGIILANWLLMEAIGALSGGFWGKRTVRPQQVFMFLYLGYILVLPGALYFSRDIIQRLFPLLPGQGVGYFPIFISSLVILTLPSIFHGAHFPISAILLKKHTSLHNPEGSAYFYETFGTLLAGILFTFIFSRWDNVFLVYIILSVILLSVSGIINLCIFSHRKTGIICLASALFLGCGGGNISSFLHNSSLKRQWFEKLPVHYSHSYHGNIMVFQDEDEHYFYYDGRPFLFVPYPEIDIIHDFVHFTLASHPGPEKALIIGGAHGPLLREVLQHPLEKVVYTEIDPDLIKVMDYYFPEPLQDDLKDARLKKKYQDGRLYLARSREKYDYIGLGFITPESLQTNRYFTREFFGLVKEKLHEEGIFAFSLPGSLHYLPPALRNLHATIRITLQDVFEEVKIIPGETTIYLASSREITFCSQTIMNRLLERQIDSGFIHHSYVDYRFDRNRKAWFYSMIDREYPTLNRDLLPRGFYYAALNWQQQFSPTAGRMQQQIENISFTMILYILAGVGILWLFYNRRLSKNKESCLAIIIGTTGITGMAFDLMVLFLFQCLYGYVYQMIGLLMSMFMLGTFTGSRWSIQQSLRKNPSHLLLKTELLLIISLMFIFLVGRFFQYFAVIPNILAVVIFIALSFALGFLIGGQFPLATHLRNRNKEKTSGTASLLYASDLFGGWAGGLLFSLILFPYFGLNKTLLFLGTLKIFTFLSLFVSESGNRSR